MALSSPPAAPQRGDRTTFAQRVDAFITWLIGFVSELNIFSANLNTLAAGGAYSIPFKFVTSGAAIGGPNGNLSIGNGATQSAATFIAFDAVDLAGMTVKSNLDDLLSSNSAAKGHVRIVKVGDPSAWVRYRIDSWVYTGGAFPYGTVTGVCVGFSSANPFSAGDSLIAQFQRTGDKGDTGSMQTIRSMLVRDQRAAGVYPQTLSSGSWNTRVLNTVSWNDIAGASLAGNIISLPAGLYHIDATVPVLGGGPHVARLFDVTNNGSYDIGTPERTYYGEVTGRSIIRTVINVLAPIQIRIDQYVASGSPSGGAPTGTIAEIYTEVKITKVG